MSVRDDIRDRACGLALDLTSDEADDIATELLTADLDPAPTREARMVRRLCLIFVQAAEAELAAKRGRVRRLLRLVEKEELRRCSTARSAW